MYKNNVHNKNYYVANFYFPNTDEFITIKLSGPSINRANDITPECL